VKLPQPLAARVGSARIFLVDASVEGIRVAHQVVVYVLALVPISLLPTVFGLTGWLYFIGALVLGLGFAATGFEVAIRRTNASAKRLLFASIVYLPVLLALMAIDKN